MEVWFLFYVLHLVVVGPLFSFHLFSLSPSTSVCEKENEEKDKEDARPRMDKVLLFAWLWAMRLPMHNSSSIPSSAQRKKTFYVFCLRFYVHFDAAAAAVPTQQGTPQTRRDKWRVMGSTKDTSTSFFVCVRYFCTRALIFLLPPSEILDSFVCQNQRERKKTSLLRAYPKKSYFPLTLKAFMQESNFPRSLGPFILISFSPILIFYGGRVDWRRKW